MIMSFLRNQQSLAVRACLIAALLLGWGAFLTSARAAESKAASDTNDVLPEAPVPPSVFDLNKPYKDPFFPNSMRKRVQATAAPVVISTSDPSQYVLKGISGVPGQRIVIINNRNLAEGERGEVTLPGGTTVSITVLKIDQHSAMILPDGQREPFLISLPKEDW